MITFILVFTLLCVLTYAFRPRYHIKFLKVDGIFYGNISIPAHEGYTFEECFNLWAAKKKLKYTRFTYDYVERRGRL